jgi:hypothetical protein
MYILTDNKSKITGYLYNNVILLPDRAVAGVLLAHCVFTQQGEVKGKFFDECLYTESGEILAKQGKGETIDISIEQGAQIMKEAWTILSHTTNHVFPWVEAGKKWSKVSLKDFLLQKKN